MAPSLPFSVGVKVTVMVHDFPGPTPVPHVWVRLNSTVSAPAITMPVMLSVVLPAFVTVVAWVELDPTG